MFHPLAQEVVPPWHGKTVDENGGGFLRRRDSRNGVSLSRAKQDILDFFSKFATNFFIRIERKNIVSGRFSIAEFFCAA